MKERPILFSAAMVRAILRDKDPKTQTRRMGKIQCDKWTELGVEYSRHATKGLEAVATYRAFPGRGTARWGICACPYGVPGDRLWVKETFWINHYEFVEGRLPKVRPNELIEHPDDWGPKILFRADGECCDQIPECECFTEGNPKWRPSLFMPRWASRITLEVTAVRVERLQEITADDCIAEGIQYEDHKCGCERCATTSQICPASASSLIMAYQNLWESINGTGSWTTNPWVFVISFRRIK